MPRTAGSLLVRLVWIPLIGPALRSTGTKRIVLLVIAVTSAFSVFLWSRTPSRPFRRIEVQWGLGDSIPSSVQVDLTSFFNAKAASTGLDDARADFDGTGSAFPQHELPSESALTYRGIPFQLPPFYHPSRFDTIRSASQIIPVARHVRYQSLHALGAAVWPASSFSQPVTGNISLMFDDGSVHLSSITFGPWYASEFFTGVMNGAIHTPWHYGPSTENHAINRNITQIHYSEAYVPSAVPLVAIQLPPKDILINWFSITLRPIGYDVGPRPRPELPTYPVLGIQSVHSTTKWFDTGLCQSSSRIQQIEVRLDNLAPLGSPTSAWLTSAHTVTLNSSSLLTVVPGIVYRLRSNDQVSVLVGVCNAEGVRPGSPAQISVIVKDVAGNPVHTSDQWLVTAGIPGWTMGDASLDTHEAPEWFDDAKFGILVHWGIYSVPAWAPVGEQYAEWYNWQLHEHDGTNSPTWEHHRTVYGLDVVYDDFIADFLTSSWNPDKWVDLFSDAGAKYFVFTAKHHDGFSLFEDPSLSLRNSVDMGPRHDILEELFASARARHPDLRRGAYFSLPEWFNPDYAPYSHSSFPGRPAHYMRNDSCCEPYAGYVPVQDFIQDVQKIQMEALLFNYDTDILWCDAGGASAYPQIAANWYNYAASQNRQVTQNNRCGANQTDFVSIDYSKSGGRLPQKWESAAGVDPHSFGFNSATPVHLYQNASSLIPELVDIVSKGGNFLVNVGPKADGTIVPAQQEPLIEMGRWLRSSGEAIYGTRPWWIQSGDDTFTAVRFTTKPDAFYIISIVRPVDGVLRTVAPVPIVEGDVVTLLGGSGQHLAWSSDDVGVFCVEVSEQELDRSQYAWAFKISY